MFWSCDCLNWCGSRFEALPTMSPEVTDRADKLKMGETIDSKNRQ
jgi:hypothetical protein